MANKWLYQLSMTMVITLMTNVGLAVVPYQQKQGEILSFVEYSEISAGSQGALSHLFFSNNQYCFMMAGGGSVVTVAGEWHYQSPTDIGIHLKPFSKMGLDQDDGFLKSFKPSYQIADDSLRFFWNAAIEPQGEFVKTDTVKQTTLDLNSSSDEILTYELCQTSDIHHFS